MNLEGLGLHASVLLGSSRSVAGLKEGSVLASALQCTRVFLVVSPCSERTQNPMGVTSLWGLRKVQEQQTEVTLRSDLLEVFWFVFFNHSFSNSFAPDTRAN